MPLHSYKGQLPDIVSARLQQIQGVFDFVKIGIRPYNLPDQPLGRFVFSDLLMAACLQEQVIQHCFFGVNTILAKEG